MFHPFLTNFSTCSIFSEFFGGLTFKMSICFRIPRLTHCCLCIDLRIGALTLAVLNFLASLFFLTIFGIALGVAATSDDTGK